MRRIIRQIKAELIAAIPTFLEVIVVMSLLIGIYVFADYINQP